MDQHLICNLKTFSFSQQVHVPAEPPLGFSPGLSIRFTEGMLPRANTCINAMYLPMNTVTPEEFIHNNYVFWLTQCCRFWAGLGVEGRK